MKISNTVLGAGFYLLSFGISFPVLADESIGKDTAKAASNSVRDSESRAKPTTTDAKDTLSGETDTQTGKPSADTVSQSDWPKTNPGSSPAVTGSVGEAAEKDSTQVSQAPQGPIVSSERKEAMEALRYRHLWIAYGAAWLLIFGLMFRTSKQNDGTRQEIESLKKRLARLESSEENGQGGGQSNPMAGDS